MVIIVLHEVTASQQRAIARVLGRRDVSHDDVRAFLQRSGEQTLEALALPLVSRTNPLFVQA